MTQVTADIQAIRERWSKATKGPWFWSGYVSRTTKKATDINLVTGWGGRKIVMMFDRVGWADAQPLFQPKGGQFGMQCARDLVVYEQDYRDQICGIGHPDAEAIAAAPEDVRLLLQEIDRMQHQVGLLEAEVEVLSPKWHPVSEPPAESGTYLAVLADFPVVLYYNAEEGFWDEDEHGNALVTHWMPLPPAPEDV